MKLNPELSWQHVAIVAVLAVAAVVAGIYSPGAISVIVSLIGIAGAWLTKNPAKVDKPPSELPAIAFLLAFAGAGISAACGPYLGPEQRQDLARHQDQLEVCKEQARAATRDAGKAEAGLAQYEACKKDSGL